jgi:hypothetical protein
VPDGQEKLTEGRGPCDPGERSRAFSCSWFETALTRPLTMREMDVIILKMDVLIPA